MNSKWLLIFTIIFALCTAHMPAYAEEEAPKAEEGKEGGEGGEKKPELPASKKNAVEEQSGNASYIGPYIELKQINVVGIYRGQPVQHMNYIIVVELLNEEEYKYALSKVEVLRASFVEQLHVIGSSQRGALLKNFDFLKSRLLQTAERTLGPGHVKDILVKSSAGRYLPEYYMQDKTTKPNAK